MLIDKHDIEKAFATIHKWFPPTPLIRSHFLSDRLDANIWLKLETTQPTHSFKVRGACNAITNLPEQARQRGVITASGGNHGLALAYAAHTLGIPATVLLPQTTPPDRIQTIRAFNADVVLHGRSWDEANVRAVEIARLEGRSYIHPFDDADVMAGQGTIVCELVKQLRRIDTLIASIGGGGLLSGIISAAAALTPKTSIVGVETEGADSMFQSWRAGKIVELSAITSVAETLGARKTAKRQFDIITGYANSLCTVTDQQAIDALLLLLDREKLLTEPAASCSVAALLAGKIEPKRGDNVVVVLCGANVGLHRLAKWMSDAGARRGPAL